MLQKVKVIINMNFSILKRFSVQSYSQSILRKIKAQECLYYYSDIKNEKSDLEHKKLSEITKIHSETQMHNKHEELETPTPEPNKVGGFAKAFEKFSLTVEEDEDNSIKESQLVKQSKPFLTLLRHSKFMQVRISGIFNSFN